MKLKSLLAVALVAGASSAMASDFYVAGSVGQSSINMGTGSIDADLRAEGFTGVSSNTDENDTAYKLTAGWQFHKNFALELGYFDLGKGNYTANFTGPVAGTVKAEWKADGWGIGIVGKLPINEQFSVFARVAAVDAKVKLNVSASGPGVSVSDSADSADWKGNYGLGAQWDFTKQFGVRAEYERFDKLGDSNKTGEADVDLWSVGLVFKF